MLTIWFWLIFWEQYDIIHICYTKVITFLVMIMYGILFLNLFDKYYQINCDKLILSSSCMNFPSRGGNLEAKKHAYDIK